MKLISMMSETQIKSTLCFIPRELATPNKDNSEVSKTIYMRVSSLHNLLSDWVKLISKGTKICKSISELKLHECKDNYYPHQTKVFSESLVEIQDSLNNIVDGIEIINNQLKALAKIQPKGAPVIFTWSALQISVNVSRILTYIQKEYALKLTVVENIAHCRDKNLMDVYVGAWEFNVYLNIESYEYLFAETGLPGITS